MTCELKLRYNIMALSIGVPFWCMHIRQWGFSPLILKILCSPKDLPFSFALSYSKSYAALNTFPTFLERHYILRYRGGDCWFLNHNQ